MRVTCCQNYFMPSRDDPERMPDRTLASAGVRLLIVLRPAASCYIAPARFAGWPQRASASSSCPHLASNVHPASASLSLFASAGLTHLSLCACSSLRQPAHLLDCCLACLHACRLASLLLPASAGLGLSLLACVSVVVSACSLQLLAPTCLLWLAGLLACLPD